MTPGVHQYSLQERVLYGHRVTDALPEELARIGARKVFVVTNRSLHQTPALEKVRTALGDAFAGVYPDVRAHAPRDCVIEGALAARAAGADLLLAAGGGSVVDAAKVMLLCLRHRLTHAAELDTHAGTRWAPSGTRPADADRWLRMIAVPTTLSGAEYTHVGGATDRARSVKQGFSHPMMVPQAVILDPEMTLTAPLRLLLATGIKAVDHAVERIASVQANPYSDAVSELALRLLSAGLPAVHANPADMGARLELQYGVFMSMCGSASGARVGVSHAIGHALGAYSQVAHGDTSCVLLPAVMHWIGDAIPDRQRRVCEALGATGVDSSVPLAALVARLGLPSRLRDVGVKMEDFDGIAERTLQDPLIGNSPRKLAGAGDVIPILRSAW